MQNKNWGNYYFYFINIWYKNNTKIEFGILLFNTVDWVADIHGTSG